MEQKYRRKNPELNRHAVEAFQYNRYRTMPEWFTKCFVPEKGMYYSNFFKTVRVFTVYGEAEIHDGQWVVSQFPEVGFMVMDENIFNDLYELVEEPKPSSSNGVVRDLMAFLDDPDRFTLFYTKALIKDAATEIDRISNDVIGLYKENAELRKKLQEPKKYTAAEALAWVYKKMQEEENNG